MPDFIPYGRQIISDADVEAIVKTLRSDYLTQGPVVPQFEAALAEMCGARSAVAVNSATSALHIACLAMELGPGDTLWTTPNTFVASANCALYCGAGVDFVDIDPRTYNMSVGRLQAKLEAAEANGRLPKVVVPVDFSGQPCDLEAIRGLADRFGFRIIEDASHAVGASYRGEPVGSGRYADITIFSFHPVKVVTTAEGGLALTNDRTLATRMARLRTHGTTRDPEQMVGESEGAWYYQQVELGLNYRMTELQASLGLSQLDRLEEFVSRRGDLAARYDRLLEDLPVKKPFVADDVRSAWHLYVVQVDPAIRRQVFDRMRAAGIGVNVHYIPVHTQPYYRQFGFRPGDYPEAEKYYASAITLPLHPGLSEEDQDRVVEVLADAIAAVGKESSRAYGSVKDSIGVAR